ncbi:MAG: hypothetical protein CR991_05560 [Proteobacteria bacterium]|nr:MAG: hypothetical protein CR991_05560 [Pseudomonadota bacterium]
MRLTYWREGQTEVEYGQQLLAIEAKSGRHKGVLIGLKSFARHFDQYKVIPLIVGTGGIYVELFLKTPSVDWF